MIAVLLRTSRQSCTITMADKLILFCLSASGLEQIFGRCRWVDQMRCSQSANICGCLTGTLKHPETKSLSKLIAIVATPCAPLRFALSRLTWSHLQIP